MKRSDFNVQIKCDNSKNLTDEDMQDKMDDIIKDVIQSIVNKLEGLNKKDTLNLLFHLAIGIMLNHMDIIVENSNMTELQMLTMIMQRLENDWESIQTTKKSMRKIN